MMPLTAGSSFRCFNTRRTCGRTVFLFLCLCATLGFVYHVSTVDSTRNVSYVLDHPSLLIQVPNHATRSLNSAQRARSGRLFPVPAPLGPNSRNSDNTSSNLKLTVASSTTKIMPDPWSEDELARVDAKRKSMDDLASEAAATIRNIPSPPFILGKDKKSPKYFRNSSCARFPTIHHLEFSNIYWQTLRTSKGTFYLYGAYYDDRTRNPLGPSLRILGMMHQLTPEISTYCQIWFQGEKEPKFSKVLKYDYINYFRSWRHYNRDLYQPYLLTCPYSHHNGKVPTSVSLVEKPCDAATNNLRVLFNKPAKKQPFAVCVKGLRYVHVDISVRLVEWIELLGILGANKIFIYNYAVHPNANEVLRYYEERGIVDLTPLTLPGSQPNDPRLLHIFMDQHTQQRRLNQVIPLNDCLYRNLHQYEYIAVIDIDEVMVPMKGGGWTELMVEVDGKSRRTQNVSRSSYCFLYTYFMDLMVEENQWFQGIPKYLHMLQHVYHTPVQKKPVRGDDMKCFIDPEQVLTLNNHFPRACLNASCTSYSVGTDLAQLHHYRDNCVLSMKKCTKQYRESMLKDTTIWHYKGELIDRARNVLKDLGFIPSSHSTVTKGLV